MVDFIHNKEIDKGKELPKVSNTKKQASIDKPSWLRGLLHPVNRKNIDENHTIDLLAVAKKQVQATALKSSIMSISTNKEKLKINPVKVKKDIDKAKPFFSLGKKVKNDDIKKKLSTEGSEKVKKSFDVNLLPVTVRFQSTNKIVALLFLWSLVAIGVLAIIYVGISFYGQQITEEGLALETEIEFLATEIVKYNNEVAGAVEWQVKLSAVDTLLKTHIYWTNFFSALERTTLPSVYYSGFTASLVNSNINLVSYAKNFTTVAEQLIAYEKFPKVFNSFSVAEASLDEGIGINYNALVSLRRSLFYDKGFLKQAEISY